MEVNMGVVELRELVKNGKTIVKNERVSDSGQSTGSKRCAHKWDWGHQNFEGWCAHWCSKCGALRETEMQPNGKEKSTFSYPSNERGERHGE